MFLNPLALFAVVPPAVITLAGLRLLPTAFALQLQSTDNEIFICVAVKHAEDESPLSHLG